MNNQLDVENNGMFPEGFPIPNEKNESSQMNEYRNFFENYYNK